jgi:hypothetical protein
MRRTRIAQMMDNTMSLDNYPMDNSPMPRDPEMQINPTINDLGENPKIESFAKPASVNIKDENGTTHSFAVEIKSSKNGPIPDTQLMSKILQAVEGSNTNEFSNDGEEPTKFEVVSFKYERRDNKK